MDRKLITILAADVVGYSRLMGEDEAGTLQALKRHRADLIDLKAAQYGGRTIKLMGDGILMEFPSVVEAVKFAIEVQCAMRERNADVDEDKRIVFRIGVNIGDVIIEGDDIYGDGVNVAARLEGLAEPGGICVRRKVRNEVRDKLDIDFDDLGEMAVKNIARPVKAFSVVINDKTAAMVTPISKTGEATTQRPRWLAIAAAVVVLLGLGGATFYWRSGQAPQQTGVTHDQVEASLVVLPFADMSSKADLDYFADGMTEDIITELSKNPGLRVVSRNSSFTYKGRAVKAGQVRDELGVKFVLEGSVRKQGDRVRITAQLIDAATDAHVWADNFDEEGTDIFELQDRVTAKTGATLGGGEGKIRKAEYKRAWTMDAAKLEEYDYYLRGHSKFYGYTYDAMLEARQIWQDGLKKFPNSGLLRVKIGWTYFNVFNLGWSKEPEKDLERAFALAQEGIADSQLLPVGQWAGHWLNAFVQLYQERDHAFALEEAKSTLDLVSNDPETLAHLATIAIFAGEPDLAIEWVERAKRREPDVPTWYYIPIGRAYHLKGNCKSAIEALKSWPYFDLRVAAPLADCYLQLDRPGDAEAMFSKLLAQQPGLTVKDLTLAFPYKDQAMFDRLHRVAKQLGLPE